MINHLLLTVLTDKPRQTEPDWDSDHTQMKIKVDSGDSDWRTGAVLTAGRSVWVALEPLA